MYGSVSYGSTSYGSGYQGPPNRFIELAESLGIVEDLSIYLPILVVTLGDEMEVAEVALISTSDPNVSVEDLLSMAENIESVASLADIEVFSAAELAEWVNLDFIRELAVSDGLIILDSADVDMTQFRTRVDGALHRGIITRRQPVGVTR